LPIHPTLGQDWDSAPTAIDWPRLRAFLRTVKRTARLPDDHTSHDHLNEQKPVELGDSLAARCKEELARVQKEVEAASGVRVVWGLVDGFLLYWDPVRSHLAALIIVAVLQIDLLLRRSLIHSMLGYSFVCRTTYSGNEGQSVRCMLLPVGSTAALVSIPRPLCPSFLF
jgi:hypothetical protein